MLLSRCPRDCVGFGDAGHTSQRALGSVCAGLIGEPEPAPRCKFIRGQ